MDGDQNLISVDGDTFPGRAMEVYLLFNSDIVNYHLKTTSERQKT